MIVKDIKYDPIRDLQPVDQVGFIDLKNALAHSAVPSQLPDSEVEYNGIDEPAAIGGKPTDIFEALDMVGDIDAAASAEGEKDSANG